MIILPFSLPHLYISLLKGWENVLFELGSERVNEWAMYRFASGTFALMAISRSTMTNPFKTFCARLQEQISFGGVDAGEAPAVMVVQIFKHYGL